MILTLIQIPNLKNKVRLNTIITITVITITPVFPTKNPLLIKKSP